MSDGRLFVAEASSLVSFNAHDVWVIYMVFEAKGNAKNDFQKEEGKA